MKILFLISFILFSQMIFAETFDLSASNGNVVGNIINIKVKNKTTLYQLGKDYDIGVLEMIEANPKINPYHPILAGTNVVIPNQFVLPENNKGQLQGLFINLAELRIFYYPKDQNVVKTYPIAIGRIGWNTPLTNFDHPAYITEITKYPRWYPPVSLRKIQIEKTGKDLPPFVSPGVLNPLGLYKLRTSISALGDYLIHGTSDQNSVGLRVSSGCIRLWSADIKDLYQTVILNADKTIPDDENPKELKPIVMWLPNKLSPKIYVINSPNLIGIEGNKIYLAAHQPLSDDPNKLNLSQEIDAIKEQTNKYQGNINWSFVKEVLQKPSGEPVVIGQVIDKNAI